VVEEYLSRGTEPLALAGGCSKKKKLGSNSIEQERKTTPCNRRHGEGNPIGSNVNGPGGQLRKSENFANEVGKKKNFPSEDGKDKTRLSDGPHMVPVRGTGKHKLGGEKMEREGSGEGSSFHAF